MTHYQPSRLGARCAWKTTAEKLLSIIYPSVYAGVIWLVLANAKMEPTTSQLSNLQLTTSVCLFFSIKCMDLKHPVFVTQKLAQLASEAAMVVCLCYAGC